MKVLFICTGNTCRSPMAEGIFNHISEGAVSRGLMAYEGQMASENAVKAMLERGIDISSHRARQLTKEDVEGADVVFTMTENHKKAVLNVLPHTKDKVHTIGEYTGGKDISDPYGADAEVYKSCCRELYESIEKIVEKLK